MPRGGRRPGAGAPRGNLNAYKGSGRSETFQRAVLILAVSPEVRALFKAVASHREALERPGRIEDNLAETLNLALKGLAQDPTLARAIKDLLLERLDRFTPQLRRAMQVVENDRKTIAQSNDDLIDSLKDSLQPLNKRSGCPSSVCCQQYPIPCDRERIEAYLGNPIPPKARARARSRTAPLLDAVDAIQGPKPLSRRQLQQLRLRLKTQIFLAEANIVQDH